MPSNDLTETTPVNLSYIKGNTNFELATHTSVMLSTGLGNVLSMVSDRLFSTETYSGSGIVEHYSADIVSSTDYYPGVYTERSRSGMQMPGRSFSSNLYRYGFNGMEKDDEVKGEGNSYTAEFWQYDSRLGRRWNTDPVVKPWESPYATFRNNPIYYADPSGLNGEPTTHTTKKDETLWGVSKDHYDKNGYGDKSWGDYWSDVLSWNEGGDYGKVGGTMILSNPNGESEAEGPSQPIVLPIKSNSTPEMPIPYVNPSNDLRVGMGNSTVSFGGSYGWGTLVVHTEGASGYWHPKYTANVSGFSPTGSSSFSVELLSASLGSVFIDPSSFNNLQTNDLSVILNSGNYTNTAGLQLGFKYTNIKGFNNMGDMSLVWEMSLWGFGLGSGAGGNRSFIEFKPAFIMNHADSLERAIINAGFRAEFELFLIEEY